MRAPRSTAPRPRPVSDTAPPTAHTMIRVYGCRNCIHHARVSRRIYWTYAAPMRHIVTLEFCTVALSRGYACTQRGTRDALPLGMTHTAKLTDTVTIIYHHIVDTVALTGTWTGERTDALDAGIDLLDASRTGEGRYRYYADETGSYWEVSESDVARLGAADLSGASDHYTAWCQDTLASEIVLCDACSEILDEGECGLAEVVATWTDADGVEDDEEYKVCRFCLGAGAAGGPGYTAVAEAEVSS